MEYGLLKKMYNQLVFKFPTIKKYFKKDFYVSESNQEAYNFVDSWPKWIKKIVNIYGDHGSGKTHLSSILQEKTKSLLLNSKQKKGHEILNICSSNPVKITSVISYLNKLLKKPKVKIIGSRHGEKFHETLLTKEEFKKTINFKIGSFIIKEYIFYLFPS